MLCAERGPKRARKSPYVYFPNIKESFDRNVRCEIRLRMAVLKSCTIQEKH